MRNDDDQPVFSVLSGDAADDADLERLDREAAAKAGMMPDTGPENADGSDGEADRRNDDRGDKAMAPDGFRTATEVLRHLELEGRKVSKSKLSRDIRAGLLLRKKGMFLKRDVERYALGLEMMDTPLAKADEFQERAVKKENLAISGLEIENKIKALRFSIMEGRHIPRDLVEQELAARAVALMSGLKTAFEANAADLCAAAGGDVSHGAALARKLETVCDDAFAQYARSVEFDVSIEDDHADDMAAAPDGGE